MSQAERLRAKVLNEEVRFEIIEHDGDYFAVRQSNSRIAKALGKHKDDGHSRAVELVIQVTHEPVPVNGPDGNQLEEEAQVQVMEPELDEKGMPKTEPMLDPTGRPFVYEGTPMMRAKLKPKVDVDGNPVFETVKKPKFTLGKQLFDKTFFDSLMEAGNGPGTFIHKVANAAVRANNREEASERAKKV